MRTLTRTASSLGQKIVNHVRATKRALARWGQSSKAKPKQRKAQGKKVLKKVTQLATDTLEHSRQAFEKLSKLAPAPLKEKFRAQIGLAKELLEQTEKKLAAQRLIRGERIVSFFDPHARAIVKGKLDKPVEFGRTMELVQDDSGVIVHYEVHQGNPSDKVHLLSLVRQTKKVLNQSPQELAADRGFYSAQNLLKLRRLKVRRVGIPKIGRLTPSETQHQRTQWFRDRTVSLRDRSLHQHA